MRHTSAELAAIHYQAMVMMVRDSYSAIRTFALPQDEAIKHLQRIYDHPSYKKMGAGFRRQLAGVIDQCAHQHLLGLVWCFCLGGEFVPASVAERHPKWAGWDKLDKDKSKLCYPPNATRKAYKPY